MDNFFQKLRDIQKKERSTGTLSEIDDSFYTDASNYLQDLLKKVNNNPLSLEAYQLRDSQRIVTEICERREFKIVSTAATNVQKSHDIFKGHKQDSELYDVIPYNTTPEEEEFYREIVDMMVNHRENLMEKVIINKKSTETRIGFKSKSKKVVKEPPVPEEAVVKEEIPQQKDETESVEETDIPKSAFTPPVLDESQIAMMFGKAPDDILLDENNNPVKPIKKDITTPFKGPKPPKEDTVSLQNSDKKDDAVEKQEEVLKEKTLSDESESKEQSLPDEAEGRNESSSEDLEITEESPQYSDVELVEFKQEVTTDILDENEKTYGPFLMDDIVLLPKSIAEILNINNVVNIIK